MAEKSVGRDELEIMLTGAIQDGMKEYFSEEQRLQPEMCAAFASNILDDYRYESVGDMAVFLRKASMGRYGERDARTGEITGKGKTFGRITTTLLGAWWEQYLDEKAQEAEAVRLKRRDGIDWQVIHHSLTDALRKAADDGVERNEAREIAKLVKYIHLLTDDQLRAKWKKVRSAHGRSLIMYEANKRGLVQKRIEEQLNDLEAKKP